MGMKGLFPIFGLNLPTDKAYSFVFYYEITRSLGLAGLFEYVSELSQNRSDKIYLFSFENIQNSPPNPALVIFKITKYK